LGDIDALRIVLSAEQLADREAEAHLKLLIAKLKHGRSVHRPSMARKLVNQMELEFKGLEATASEAATLLEHPPRGRVVIEGPSACPCCGGKLAKLGETITETLELIPGTGR
jgi:hypothetical protein